MCLDFGTDGRTSVEVSELVQLRARPAPARFALFEKGFRPLFLLAALFAVGGIPLWLVVRRGALAVGDPLLPSVWHAHEMVFGFAGAVIAGFLLTAAANWTKRETLVGFWLAALCVVWIAGRAALLLGLDARIAAGASLAFFPLLALAVGRPIALAQSRRNYGIVGLLVLLFAAQGLTHLGARAGDVAWQTLGPRLGLGLVVVLVLVIGGRIIPLFTKNATGAEDIRTYPWLDRASIATALAAVVLDAASVRGPALAILLGLAALTAAARAIRWGAARSFGEPLLWVLHLGYAFVPLGFALRAAAVLSPRVDDSSALHAWTVGAIGTLVLGIMTRVSLGHTGRPLRAGKVMGVAFALVAIAALVRVIGPLAGLASPALDASGGLFALAYALYLVRIGPSLLVSRPDGKPG
ncbi:MAG: NnrS family protein [Sandaracinaceae bacterium]